MKSDQLAIEGPSWLLRLVIKNVCQFDGNVEHQSRAALACLGELLAAVTQVEEPLDEPWGPPAIDQARREALATLGQAFLEASIAERETS
jgi:hypothetical protein